MYLCAHHCPIPPLLLFSVYLFVVEPLAACSLFSHTRAIAVDVFPCEQFEDAPLQSEMGESDYDGPDDENYKQKKPTVMRLLRFGKPELPLVITGASSRPRSVACACSPLTPSQPPSCPPSPPCST